MQALVPPITMVAFKRQPWVVQSQPRQAKAARVPVTELVVSPVETHLPDSIVVHRMVP